MSVYPYSRLFVGPTRTVVISGPHIQVVDTQTGAVLHATTSEEAEKTASVKGGPIRCSAVDVEFKHLVTCGEDKQMKVWRVDGLARLNSRELPKKPTEVRLTEDGLTILVSDKFGDIFSYPLHAEQTPSMPAPASTAASKRGALTSHENPSNGTLILGHTSLLTTFFLTADEQYVVSADRDEHIRVSWYPQGYVIERFCLGHQKYVSALHTPSFASHILLSGGGDPTIKIWNWMSGECLGDIPIMAAVSPFLLVKPPKGRRGWYVNDGDDEQAQPESSSKRKGGKRKGKGKRKAGAEEAEEPIVYAEGAEDTPMGEPEEVDVPVQERAEPEPVTVNTQDDEQAPEEKADEPVLVVRRIDSIELPEQGQFFLFNAVGATSLFYGHLPPSPTPDSDIAVQALDFGKPVIDFALTADGLVWVLLDGEYQSSAVADTRAVRLAKWAGGTLNEVSDEASDVSTLLSALNSTCLLPATSEELKTLDIYSDLASLPKNVDPERDATRKGGYGGLDVSDDESPRAETPQAGPTQTRELTQRELARLKKKKAVMAKIHENEQVKPGARKADSIAPEDERDVKKVKAGQDAGQGTGDVTMGEAS